MLARSSLAFRYFIGTSSHAVPCPNLSQPVWQPKVSQPWWYSLRLFFHNCCATLFWDCNNKFWGFLESLVILLAIHIRQQSCYLLVSLRILWKIYNLQWHAFVLCCCHFSFSTMYRNLSLIACVIWWRLKERTRIMVPCMVCPTSERTSWGNQMVVLELICFNARETL
jgi:hypothetical protein